MAKRRKRKLQPRLRRAKILDRHYQIVFVPRDQLGEKLSGLKRSENGDCDPPGVKNKTIRIAEGLGAWKELEILAHEFLHAAAWYMDDEWVCEAAEDFVRILKRVGYRLERVDPAPADVKP